MKMSWLLGALVLVSILAGIHLYAIPHFLYWYYPWLDIPVHILGGGAIATFVIGLLGRYRPLLFLAAILLTAFGWEVFEYIFSISTGQPNYWIDTSHDVLNDILGAIVVYTIARFSIWR